MFKTMTQLTLQIVVLTHLLSHQDDLLRVSSLSPFLLSPIPQSQASKESLLSDRCLSMYSYLFSLPFFQM